MDSISSYSLFLIFTIISHSFLIFEVGCDVVIDSSKRSGSSGGGGGSNTPPEERPNSGVCLPPDYTAIQRLKKLVTYDPQDVTKSWKEEFINVCEAVSKGYYKGFDCDIRPDKGSRAVAAVNFNGYNFDGPNFQLVDFLDQLTDLAIFHANSNNFTGIVPEGVGIRNINFLHELDLSNNNYSSGFPMNVLQATNLTFLDLRFNKFYGPVPREVFNLDLDVLFLNNNKFDQQLPDNIGDTPALYLTFANNLFTGSIPSSIGSAKYLLEVLFSNNRFTGCLPYEIGFLKNLSLFDVSCNQLSGPIPHSFGCLENIQIMNLAKNQFYGAVPEMLCMIPNLQNLSLSDNYFTQVGPECRKLICSNKLDIGKNCVADLPYQRPHEECADFFSKPLQCLHNKSLRLIPCEKNGSPTSTETTIYQQSKIPAAPPRSYDALSPTNKIQF